MKRFFGTDSPLFRFMTILLELAEINLLFILCSLPVVTMGASYAAMTDSMNEMHVHGEGCFSAKRFFQVFKKSLKPMIPIGTVILVCCVGLGFNVNYVLKTMEGTGRILFCGIYVVLFLILSGIFQYSAFIAAKTEKWNKDESEKQFSAGFGQISSGDPDYTSHCFSSFGTYDVCITYAAYAAADSSLLVFLSCLRLCRITQKGTKAAASGAVQRGRLEIRI